MSGEDLQLPPGFRFHPTDEELVEHYLCRKCAAQPITVPVIADVNLYLYDPWQLPGMTSYGEKEWYFFSPRDRKYRNGSRPNRAAGSGYWKATGADKSIGVPKTLGIKKALVFYSGKAPKGVKTNWIMHEYRLAAVDRSANRDNSLRLDDWVLCRIYNKKGGSEVKPTSRPGLTPAATPEIVPKQEFHQTGLMMPPPPPPPPPQGQTLDYLYFDHSDSIPRIHTDSSSSEHVPSSCEREVESRLTAGSIRDWDRHIDVRPSTFPQLQPEVRLMSPAFRDPFLQDILMYLQKPF